MSANNRLTIEERIKSLNDVYEATHIEFVEALDLVEILRDENERLREALGFYGDEGNYYLEGSSLYPDGVEYDSGNKARIALNPNKDSDNGR